MAPTTGPLPLDRLDRRYRAALMAFFARRLHNPADAEDLTQEVFAKLAASKVDSFEHPDAYIFQMAANLLRDRGRREKVRADYRAVLLAGPLAEVEPIDPARVLQGRETLIEVAACLRRLPPRTRRIFLLHQLEGMKRGELASLYGISVGAVDKHILRAMAHLTRHARDDQ